MDAIYDIEQTSAEKSTDSVTVEDEQKPFQGGACNITDEDVYKEPDTTNSVANHRSEESKQCIPDEHVPYENQVTGQIKNNNRLTHKQTVNLDKPNEEKRGSKEQTVELIKWKRSSSIDDEKQAEILALIEENKRLKETKTCKICLDSDVSVLFLPCRHLACCEDCAEAVRFCPVCRVQIVATVKTYLA